MRVVGNIFYCLFFNHDIFILENQKERRVVHKLFT
jgi:hypothetical protein